MVDQTDGDPFVWFCTRAACNCPDGFDTRGVLEDAGNLLDGKQGLCLCCTQTPLSGNYRDVDVMSLFWSLFQNRSDLNYRETQQFVRGLEWAPCTPRVLSKTPPGENCTQRDELSNICYTGSVTAMSNRDVIKEQRHIEADPSADHEIRTWRRRNSQRAENCRLVLHS